MSVRRAAVVLPIAWLGCGGVLPHSRAAGTVNEFHVKPVTWNAGDVAVGPVKAVADVGGVVTVFGDGEATVFSAGAVVATDRHVKKWIAATTIGAPDRAARWIVGIDGDGRLHYLRGLSVFEDASERYGLASSHVRSAAALGNSAVAFGLDGELAVADGQRVTHYASPSFSEVAGAGNIGAGIASGSIYVFNLAKNGMQPFPLSGVIHVAVSPTGRLYASTRRAIYGSTPGGELELLYDAGAASLHGLVASGDHVWFADGPELGCVDGDRIVETTGLHMAPDAELTGSPSGDVWALSGGGLQRFTRVDAEPALTLSWRTTLAPVFGRACSSCHEPSGPSGTDLSTPEAWQSEKAAIRERVVERRTMPPQGHDLSEADRQVIRAWAELR